MACDDGKLNLTREEALKLHRQMWTEMQEKLGDNPSGDDRDEFKADWCKEHFPDHDIQNHCFLCDYANHYHCATKFCLARCPIDWESLKKISSQPSDCCAVYKGYEGDYDDDNNEIYHATPISEILALPEREVSDV